MKKEKLEAIKELKSIIDCKQFVLTGSTIMQLQGVADESNDIDIVVMGITPAGEELLKRMVTDHGWHKRNNEKLMLQGTYIFNYHGIKVDIFICDVQGTYDEKLIYDGIIISPIMRLVDAKKSYYRMKDFFQLRKWSKRIFDWTKEEESIAKAEKALDYNE